MTKHSDVSGRLNFRTIAGYGLVLGLLLASLQAAQFRLLVFDNAQEIYFGLIALFFMVLGIWAGYRLTLGRKAIGPDGARSRPDLEQALERLGITPREHEVLQHIAQGWSNQEIAERMFVSLNTVKTHTSNLFSKLDVQRRTQAVQKARDLGLLPTGPDDDAAHPKV